jgi:hypothetical protein
MLVLTSFGGGPSGFARRQARIVRAHSAVQETAHVFRSARSAPASRSGLHLLIRRRELLPEFGEVVPALFRVLREPTGTVPS